MINVFYFLLFLLHAVPVSAYQPFTVPEPSSPEKPLTSQELKKIVKILETPHERDKILKTLNALAKAQEVKEKKNLKKKFSRYTSLFVQTVTVSLSTFMDMLKKIPDIGQNLIRYLAVKKNWNEIWSAMGWIACLIFISTGIEKIFKKFHKKIINGQQALFKSFPRRQADHTNLFEPLIYSFIISPLLLIFFFPVPESLINWIWGIWLALFSGRLFASLRKFTLQTPEGDVPIFLDKTSLLLRSLYAWGWSATLIIFTILIYHYFDMDLAGEQFLLSLVFLFGLPLLFQGIREWSSTQLPAHLEDSKRLLTAPKILVKPVNTGMRYFPWALYALMWICTIEVTFGDFSLESSLIIETFLSGSIFFIFLRGRQLIDEKACTPPTRSKYMMINNLINHVRFSRFFFIKIVQWVWHLLFFITLMAIWNTCFSDIFTDILDYPVTRTAISLGVIWGFFFLLWLFADSLAHHYFTPGYKGRKNQPTPFVKTFGPMLYGIVRWIIVLLAFFITLEHFGIDLKLLVYLMSAFAFAISLGSQSLVKDIINGIFALVDGSFAVGDVVTVGAYSGKVESLSLRALTLRHSTGYLQTIPFSEVGSIINRSRDYTIVPVTVATSYRTKIGTVYEALTNAAVEMGNDPVYGKMILEPFTISGIERFNDTAVHVSASFKIQPDPGHSFEREYNLRLKKHMETLNISPPISFHEEWGKS